MVIHRLRVDFTKIQGGLQNLRPQLFLAVRLADRRPRWFGVTGPPYGARECTRISMKDLLCFEEPHMSFGLLQCYFFIRKLKGNPWSIKVWHLGLEPWAGLLRPMAFATALWAPSLTSVLLLRLLSYLSTPGGTLHQHLPAPKLERSNRTFFLLVSSFCQHLKFYIHNYKFETHLALSQME